MGQFDLRLLPNRMSETTLPDRFESLTLRAYQIAVQEQILGSETIRRYYFSNRAWTRVEQQVEVLRKEDLTKIIPALELADLAGAFEAEYPYFEGHGLVLEANGSVLSSRELLLHVLMRGYRDRLPDEPVESLAQRITADLFRELDAGETHVDFIAILVCFCSAEERIELPGGLVIRRMTPEEADHLQWGRGTQPLRVDRNDWIVTIPFKGKIRKSAISGPREEFLDPYQLARERCHPLLLALRCLAEGPVQIDTASLMCRSRISTNAEYTSFAPFRLSELIDERYVLQKANIEKLKTLFAGILGLLEVKKPKERERILLLAINRLAESRLRASLKDSALDCLIALEGFLASTPGELSYRFALNYAALATDPGERRTRYEMASGLYKIRSIIVHGKNDAPKIANEAVTYDRVVSIASAMTFELIQRALEDESFEFWDGKYWTKLLLGA